MEQFIKQLTSSSYWVINKTLYKKLGIHSTLLLQHFIDLQYKIFDGNEFYQQQHRIQEELDFTEYQVKTSIKDLIDTGLLDVKRKGIPSKNYYCINENEIQKLMLGGDDLASQVPGTLQLSATQLYSEVPGTQQRKELNKKEKEKELKEKELNYNILEEFEFPDKYKFLQD